jgi:Na+-transporting NADH:ubiquinone oxidoreductase subunit E
MIELFLKAVFAENILLALFLGMCTFLAVSNRLDTALGLGLSVVVVQTITVPVNYLISTYLLTEGSWAWAGLPDVDLSLHLIHPNAFVPWHLQSNR